MRDLSLHLLDLVQNSITAGASRVLIELKLGNDKALSVRIEDDGCGMSPELLQKVQSPFATTRTTRKVGLGIPMAAANAQLTGGDISLTSREGEGTCLILRFLTDHVDCLPLGDLAETLITLIAANPDKPDFILELSSKAGETHFSTLEIKESLGEVPIKEPEILDFLLDLLREQTKQVFGGILE